MPSGKNRTADSERRISNGCRPAASDFCPRGAQQVQHAAKLAGAEKIEDWQQLDVVHDPHRRMRKGQVREKDEPDRPEASDLRPART